MNTPSAFVVNTLIGDKTLPKWLDLTVQNLTQRPGAMGPYSAVGALLRYAAPTGRRAPVDAWLALQGPEMAAQAVTEALNTVFSVQVWLTGMDVMNLMNHPGTADRVARFLRYRDDLESLHVVLAEHPNFIAVRSAILLKMALDKLDAAAASHHNLWMTCPVEVDGRTVEAERLQMNHWWFKL